MTPEQIVLPIMRSMSERPRLSKQLFRFARWGDPFTSKRFSDPYDIFDKMTANGPVVKSRVYNQWFVSGYQEVLDVLRSPDVQSAGVIGRMLPVWPYSKLSTTAINSFTRWLLINDPPDHTRLRGAVQRAFAPKRISAMEPRLREIADSLLSDLADQPQTDIVASFTARLPIYAIGELLGLPRDRWDWLRESSVQIGQLLEPMTAFDPDEMSRRFEDLNEYFAEIADQRRSDPQDDLISALVVAEDGDVLTSDEVVAMIGLLMFAGHDTTTGLLGNTIVALAKHPDQRTLLRTQPDLIDNAVEEFLRFDSPAQFTGRVTVAPIRVGNHTIPASQSVALMIGQANRDVRRWPDPHLLRVDRADPKPLSFGHGIHHCLGASLARLETRIAIAAFLDAFGDYTIDLDSATWKCSHTLRGPTSLTVRRPRDQVSVNP
jgi:cytochrome P450